MNICCDKANELGDQGLKIFDKNIPKELKSKSESQINLTK
jgi:hypothetical protein